MAQSSQWKNVISFWFDDIRHEPSYFSERMPLWFGGTPEIDQKIRMRFETDVLDAAAGRLAHWENEGPLACLALVILLDQFSLNIFRDRPESFYRASLALPIAMRAVAKNWDQQVDVVQRPFFYLPFEHAEDLDLQRKSVELFAKLMKDSPEALKPQAAIYVDFAIRHLVVIERFRRFPDRNPIFGRPHTPEETAYMAAGGPDF